MNHTFKKILQLLEKTGDRCIVVNENGDPSYVVMTLRDFEAIMYRQSNLTEMSEKEFLEKINRDIGMWRSVKEEQQMLEWEWEEIRPKKKEKQKIEKEDMYYFEPID